MALDYKYKMFSELYEIGGKTVEGNENLKNAVKSLLGKDLKDEDVVPTMKAEEIQEREAWKEKV